MEGVEKLVKRVAEALETYVSCRHHLLRPLIVSELLKGVQYATLMPRYRS